MATDTFKSMVQAFLRRNGEGQIAITLGNPTTSFTPSPKRYTFDGSTGDSIVYDYFWLAGQSLFFAINKYTKGDFSKLLPNFRKEKTAASLTGGSYSLLKADKIERVLEPIIFTKTGQEPVIATLANQQQIMASKVAVASSTAQRRKPTDTAPLYYIENNAIKIIPATAAGTITFSYITSVARIMLNSTTLYEEQFSDNWSFLLIDGACMLAKGDNGSNLVQFYLNQLRTYYPLLQSKEVNQNNPTENQG